MRHKPPSDPNTDTPPALQYDYQGTTCLLTAGALASLAPSLEEARRLVLERDLKLLHETPEGQLPQDLRPLDAGFIELPERLLGDYEKNGERSEVGKTLDFAQRWRQELDQVVLLGIGGSYMPVRALFQALCHPYHNELSRAERESHAPDDQGPVPRFYFDGNNLDNDATFALLELLDQRCRGSDDPQHRSGLIVTSKSGSTLETTAALQLFLNLQSQDRRSHKADIADVGSWGHQPDRPLPIAKNVVVITGPSGPLRQWAEGGGACQTFTIPDRIGGRFSIFTPVGLVPAALLGLDVVKLLEGAAVMTRRFRDEPPETNPVLAYTGICHLLERDFRLTTRVLAVWTRCLEAVGFWYDQLLAESLGKNEQGATPITSVHPQDLHSRGQQHQEGRRDKLITHLVVQSPRWEPLTLGDDLWDQGEQSLAGKTLPDLMRAAYEGTCQAYEEDRRPTATISLPRLDEYCLGQLFQMLMLATVVEGRLIGINPYGQPGVEAYKRHMRELLKV